MGSLCQPISAADCADLTPATNQPRHAIIPSNQRSLQKKEEEKEKKKRQSHGIMMSQRFFSLPLPLSLPEDRFFTHKESGGKEEEERMGRKSFGRGRRHRRTSQSTNEVSARRKR